MVELWKIDGSRPAPHFNMVATPNEWRRETAHNVQVGNASDRKQRYKTFFQGLIDELRERGFTNVRKARPLNWYYFSAGHGQRVQYGATFARGKKATIEVYIDNTDKDWNKKLFDQLMARKESIESELSETLEWEQLKHRRAISIAALREGSIDDDQETLKEIEKWMIGKLLDFKRVFGPILDELIIRANAQL